VRPRRRPPGGHRAPGTVSWRDRAAVLGELARARSRHPARRRPPGGHRRRVVAVLDGGRTGHRRRGRAGGRARSPGAIVRPCSASWPALDDGARHGLPGEASTAAVRRSPAPRRRAAAGLLAVHDLPARARYRRSAAPGAVTGAAAVAEGWPCARSSRGLGAPGRRRAGRLRSRCRGAICGPALTGAAAVAGAAGRDRSRRAAAPGTVSAAASTGAWCGHWRSGCSRAAGCGPIEAARSAGRARRGLARAPGACPARSPRLWPGWPCAILARARRRLARSPSPRPGMLCRATLGIPRLRERARTHAQPYPGDHERIAARRHARRCWRRA